MLEDLKIALSFLTILPVPAGRTPQPGDLGRAAVWFPLAGLLIGLLDAAAFWLFSHLFPTFPAAALTLAVWIVLTGGLHLDGLADCCDGLLSAFPAERRLEIMRDPHHGTFAVLGLSLTLILKLAAIFSLPARFVFPALILAPVAARFFLYPAGLLAPARSEGLGYQFQSGLNRRNLYLAGILPLAGALAAGWPFLTALLISALVAGGATLFARGRIGGLTGDVLGMLVELSELTFLLFLALHIL